MATAPVGAETPRESQLHQLSQVDGSNVAAARSLRNLNVAFKSDIVYAFLIPPMTAARIEGAINPFIALLRKAGVKEDIITLAVSNRRRAAANYLRRRAFNADNNLVVGDAFLSSFVFTAGSLQVPFITKFNVRTGELLSSYSLLGKTDSSTVAWFIADLSRPKAKKPTTVSHRPTRLRTEIYRTKIRKQLKLMDGDSAPLSETYYVSVSASGSRLSLMDKYTNYIYVFDTDSGRMLNVLSPDSVEQTKFVDVPPAMYQWLKRNNLFNSMYFSHAFVDETTLVITASLPRATMEVSDNDTNISYYNAPVIMRKNALSNTLISCASFEALPDTVVGRFSHTGASFAAGGRLAFLPFGKGWPSGNQLLSESTPTDQNPFKDEFYQRCLYQFAAYTQDGRFTGMWGTLSPRFAALRLGYLSHGGLVRSRNDRYYLSDQYSGELYVYTEKAVLDDSIPLFADAPLVIPAIDRSKDPEGYLIETFKQNFKARIVDFVVNDEFCYALVLWDESQPLVYKVRLKDHATKAYALPAKFQCKEAKHYLLRETPSGIVTASLLESGDETWYCEFKLP